MLDLSVASISWLQTECYRTKWERCTTSFTIKNRNGDYDEWRNFPQFDSDLETGSGWISSNLQSRTSSSPMTANLVIKLSVISSVQHDVFPDWLTNSRRLPACFVWQSKQIFWCSNSTQHRDAIDRHFEAVCWVNNSVMEEEGRHALAMTIFANTALQSSVVRSKKILKLMPTLVPYLPCHLCARICCHCEMMPSISINT